MNVLSLFSGCGGMDLGILGGFSFLGKQYDRLPFDIVYSIDFDQYCTKIYNDNFVHKSLVGDVRDIVVDDLPEFDILVGGFPCQSFSISAQNPPRLGCKDEEKGLLFREMVRILEARKPRFFIAENVKGILSANKGQAFKLIIKEFSDVGYHIKFKVLNASLYGVPQKRERVIMVGFRDYSDFMKFYFPYPLMMKEWHVLRDVIDFKEDSNEKLFFSEKAVAGMMKNRTKMNKGRAQNLNEPCNTISSHLAKVSLNSTDPVLLVNGRYRRFSTREAAKIQSFPDDFKLDSVSETCQYRAIGNAVPPVLMWHIANALSKVINQANVQIVKTYPIQNEMPFVSEGCVIYGNPTNENLNNPQT